MKFVSDYPELLQEWDYEKNSVLPTEITSTSKKKVWWKKHYDDPTTGKHFVFEWESTVANRANGRQCPYLTIPAKAVFPGFNDLATTNPELLAEWDYEKNDLLPTEVTSGSGQKVWWKRPYDDSATGKHYEFEWEATIANRVNGRGCPFLTVPAKAIYQGFNDLATTNPKLLAEWDYDKNTILPTDVSAGSNHIVWWKVPYDDPVTGKHFIFEWQASINSRSQGRNCPYLTNPAKAVLQGFNDLATTHPTLIEEWDFDRNIIKPTEVSAGCNKKAWWHCSNGHRWEAVISSRANGECQCPYCSNVKVMAGHNDLFSQCPEVAKEWDYQKNKSHPKNVLVSSPSVVWWRCSKCGNGWKTSIRHRTQQHTNCPKCSSELKTSFDEQAIYFYLKKLYPQTQNRYLFDGKYEVDIFVPELNLGIEYDGSYYHDRRHEKDRIKETELRKRGVKFYRVIEQEKKIALTVSDSIITFHSRKKGELDRAIQSLFELMGLGLHEIDTEKDYTDIYQSFLSLSKDNSIANSPLLSEWNYEKNKDVRPEYLSVGSTKKVWWKCKEGHEWQATVGSRTGGNGCPICSGKVTLVGYNDLATTHPSLIKEWDFTKNVVLPTEITFGSGKVVWWKCSECSTEWKTRVVDRAKGRGCPVCAKRKKAQKIVARSIKDKGSLADTHPNLAAEWNYDKNDTTPEWVYAGSHNKAWWKCSKCGHEWEVAIRNRAKLGRGCPKCRCKK